MKASAEYVCFLCNKVFTKKRNLKRHIKVHEQKKIACDHCDKVFTRKYYLHEHVLNAHIDSVSSTAKLRFSKKPAKAREKLVCSMCNNKFANRSNLNRHIRAIHNKESIECDRCDKVFTRTENLRQHILKAHINGIPKSRSRKTPECSKCGKVFTAESTRKIHEQINCPVMKEELLMTYSLTGNASGSNFGNHHQPHNSDKSPRHSSSSSSSDSDSLDSCLSTQQPGTSSTTQSSPPPPGSKEEHLPAVSTQRPQVNSSSWDENLLSESRQNHLQSTCTIAEQLSEDDRNQLLSSLMNKPLPTEQDSDNAIFSNKNKQENEQPFLKLEVNDSDVCKKESNADETWISVVFGNIEADDLKQEVNCFLEAITKMENLPTVEPFFDSSKSKYGITQDLVPFAKLEPSGLNMKTKNIPQLMKDKMTKNAVLVDKLQKNNISCSGNSKSYVKHNGSFEKETLTNQTNKAPKTTAQLKNFNRRIHDRTEIPDANQRVNIQSTAPNKSTSEAIMSKTVEQEGNKPIEQQTENITDKNTSLLINSSNHVDSIFCKCSRCRVKFHEKPAFPMYYGFKYPCNKCNRKFVRSYKLKEHMETNCHQIKLYSCSYCAKGYKSKETLKSHIPTCRLGNNEEKPVGVICDICNKTFDRRNTLKFHKARVHSEAKAFKAPQTCDVCGKSYSSMKSLRSHIRRFHSQGEFECGHCAKIFKYKEKLQTHIQGEHMMGYFKCDQCSRRFIEESYLQNHKIRQHSTDAKDRIPNICEICGKTFKMKATLLTHLLSHGEKSIICDVCGKCFRTKTNLYQHSVTHSHVRPFVCDICGNSFKLRNHLRQHMAVHGMANTSWKGKRRKKNVVSSDSDDSNS